MARDWTENITLSPGYIFSPTNDISSPPGENRIDSSPVLSNESSNLNDISFDAAVNTSNPQEKKNLKRKYQDPKFAFDFVTPKIPKLEKTNTEIVTEVLDDVLICVEKRIQEIETCGDSSPNQTLVGSSNFTLSESAIVSTIEINIDSSPKVQTVLSNEEYLSSPQEDISSPTFTLSESAEVCTIDSSPSKGITSPPGDNIIDSSPKQPVLSNEEDISSPLEEIIHVDTEQPLYTESIWTCLNTRKSYVPCLEDFTKLKEKSEESYSLTEEKNIRKCTKKPRPNCTQCDETFCNVGNLNRHVQRVHQNKKFSCQNCDQEFGTKHNLDCHFNDKHAENPTIYTCDFCGQEWRHEVMFKKHKNCAGNTNLSKKKFKKN